MTYSPTIARQVSVGSSLDVNGQPGLPAIDGSQLLILPQGGHTIQDEGISLTNRDTLNFKGDLVNATDNVDTTDVTIDSGLTNLGDILYHDGSTIAPLPKGTDGQILAIFLLKSKKIH